MRVQRRFFHSGTIFRFTVLTETTPELCGSIAVKRARKGVKKFRDLRIAGRGGAAMRVQRRFFHSGTIFRFTVLTKTTAELCRSIAVKRARKLR